MQTFNIDKKTFWINEIKSWLTVIAFAILLSFIFSYFFSFKVDRIITGFCVIILLKLSDSLTQFHIKQIQIDKTTNQLTFILQSRMSGQKVMKYKLEQMTSELITNNGLKKFFSFPIVLKVYLKPKDTFSITNKYGFTNDILLLVDRELKSCTASN